MTRFSGFLLLSLFIISFVILSGCTIPPEIKMPPRPATENEKYVVDGNNQFAFHLYSNLSRDPEFQDKNIFVSPFGVFTSIAMVYEGARGDTADEIRSVFYYPNERETMRLGYRDIFSDMPKDSQGDVFLVANGLWAEKTYPFLPEYIQNIQQHYSARVSNVNFKNNPEESRLLINRWAKENTKDQIRELFPNGKITPLTRLVSTNAMYFSGSWDQPFDKGLTNDKFFFTRGNESIRVRMMHINSINHYKFNYMDSVNSSTDWRIMSAMRDYGENWYLSVNTTEDSFQMIELPYKRVSGKELSMLVILPIGKNFTAFERSFNLKKLEESREKLQSETLHVSMPKFRFETQYDLKDTLQTMGMPRAFNSSADFSGLDGTKNLFLSDVMHKAFIDVNEEGTIAAAATGSGVTQGIDPYFYANHPFIFIIQERETGNIIFMGRVINPNN